VAYERVKPTYHTDKEGKKAIGLDRTNELLDTTKVVCANI